MHAVATIISPDLIILFLFLNVDFVGLKLPLFVDFKENRLN